MLRTIRALRAAIDLDHVERLVNGALGADWAAGRIMQAMGLDQVIYEGITPLTATWERVAMAVGESSADALEDAFAIPEIDMDHFTRRVTELSRRHSGELITNLSRGRLVNGQQVGGQLQVIRDVLAANWQRTPRQLAVALKAVVGLTSRQALALERYRQALEAAGTKAKELAKLTTRERNRLGEIRANRIARTETVSMANRAQLELWAVEKEAGHLSGIDLSREFQGLAGPKKYPPAHPNCLCAVQIILLGDGRFARKWIRVPAQQECPICDSYQGQVI